jgi:MoaA/NifB/PqqE/SkfB family radical SAM enzyme
MRWSGRITGNTEITARCRLKCPYCRHPCESSVKGEQRCPGRVRESAQCVMPGFVVRAVVPLGWWFLL